MSSLSTAAEPLPEYRVAAYCRLSMEDGNGESNSISTQRELITRYAAGLGLTISEYFVDDGFSGTNFDRPAFKRLITSIEEKSINFVITKDLSRLGRNYIEAGRYTDIFFPSYGVRYIAINDNFDSARGYDDLAPFKHILNDMYSKDLSKKIKSVKKMMQQQGKFCGSLPPYGYRRSTEVKHTLAPDPATAPHVKTIFSLAAMGMTNAYIAKLLNEKNIPTPGAYLQAQGLFHLSPNTKPRWLSWQIDRILHNPVYLGTLVANRKCKPTFRSPRTIPNDPKDFFVTENAHAALIDHKEFALVQDLQRMRSYAKKPSYTTWEELFPLSHEHVDPYYGLLKCGNCGSSLVLKKRGAQTPFYTCSLYNRKGSAACTGHYVDRVRLQELLHEFLEKLYTCVTEGRFSVAPLCRSLDKQKDTLLSHRLQLQQELDEYKALAPKNRQLLEEKFRQGLVTLSLHTTLLEEQRKNQQQLVAAITANEKACKELEKKKELGCRLEEFLPLFFENGVPSDLSLLRIFERVLVTETRDSKGLSPQQTEIHLKYLGPVQM